MEPRPEFEEVPVVRLGRPRDAARIQAATMIVIVGIAILIIKPWGEPRRAEAPSARPTAAAIAPSRSIRPLATVRPDGARIYDPALFSQYSVTPRWELWPTAYVYEFGLSGPLAIDPGSGSGSGPAASSPPATPPPDAAQLIDVGAADLLMVVGLNTPAGSRVLDARLWRFPDRGAAVRIPIRELPPPWPVDTFHVYGIRVADDPDPDLVASWSPGVYRLDLLVDPGVEIHRIGLVVRAPVGSRPAAPRPTPKPTNARGSSAPVVGIDPGVLPPGTIAFGRSDGRYLEMDAAGSQRCGLAEIWLAERDRPGGPCGAIVVAELTTAAVGLGPKRIVAALRIDEIDPVQASIAVVDLTDVAEPSGAAGSTARPTGRIVSTADGRPLAEGTYRLVASLTDGSEQGWYFRIPSADGG
jgi:hypothetical protein